MEIVNKLDYEQIKMKFDLEFGSSVLSEINASFNPDSVSNRE